MCADDRMNHPLPVPVFLVQQFAFLLPSTVGKCADASLQPALQRLWQRVICSVAVGEQRIATGARNRQRIELRGLEWIGIIGAIGMPTFRAAPIDGFIELAVSVEFVNAE